MDTLHPVLPPVARTLHPASTLAAFFWVISFSWFDFQVMESQTQIATEPDTCDDPMVAVVWLGMVSYD